jgi:hypothetical protein
MIDSSAPMERQTSRRPKLLPLLEAIAAERREIPLRTFDAAQIRWIISCGLGPACFHACEKGAENPLSPHWNPLKAADLTARVIAGDHADALGEIIDAAGGRIGPITLLKGISVADEYYPEHHLRPMRDMDLFVARDDLAATETLLRDLGYRQERSPACDISETHHHLVPFFHAEKRVWIEVHHRLLSDKNRASRDRIFGLDQIMGQLRPSAFQGRSVCRLTSELELIYLAAHWAQDFKAIGGMIAAIDLIHLLKRRGATLRWDTMFQWLHGSVAAGYLFLLMSYLQRRGLIAVDEQVLREFRRGQRFAGELSLTAAHALIDRYMLDGRDFGPVLSQRNLAVAWSTLTLPLRSSCKLLLMPLNLCLPDAWRVR